MVTNLKAWYVTHLHSGKKYSSVVLSKSRYLASTYVQGEVLNVEESWGKDVREGGIMSSSGWAIGFFDNSSSKDYEVSEEWRQYLIRRNFDSGIED